MALYVPASRRRRRVITAGVAGFAIGLVAGAVLGRATAPGFVDQVRRIQDQGRAVSAQLRVVAIHQEASTPSTTPGADSGTALALSRARGELERGCREAAWIPPAECQRLIGLIDQLAATPPAATSEPEFARGVEQAATEIDRAFGIADRT